MIGVNNKIYVTNATNPRLQQMKRLEQRYFDLQMSDHWDSSDYRYAAELREKIKELKGENK